MSTNVNNPWDEKKQQKSEELLRQTNKRITLNLLIQGAAMHTMLTSHHLVKNNLEAIRPGLTKFYDKAAVSLALNYFIGDIPPLFGLPSRFWGRTHQSSHLYHKHRLLATHGRELWLASKRYLVDRGKKKWVVCIPFLHYIQMFWLIAHMAWIERGRKPYLAQLAKIANSQIWGIGTSHLEAELTRNVAFGNLREPKTRIGRMIRSGAIGYGGIERRNGEFTVVAKAWNWPLVSHELTKGTAELVCLHGINSLDEKTYRFVTDEADQIEYETWMMQAGGEMWRRLLAVLPDSQSLPETLMHIARLDPIPLEQLMMAVIETPAKAHSILDELGRA